MNKVWSYAHVLRDEGIAYGDYVEQITYLLFLKMDEERTELLERDVDHSDEVALGELEDRSLGTNSRCITAIR